MGVARPRRAPRVSLLAQVADAVSDHPTAAVITAALTGIAALVTAAGGVGVAILREMRPNSGSSFRDVADRVESGVDEVRAGVAGLAAQMGDISDRVSALEGAADTE